MELIWIPFAIIAIVLIRLLIGSLDKSRIQEAAERKGWSDIVISWAPFAPGALFEKGERSYLVEYKQDGRRRSVYCKTSLMTGVFWKDAQR